MPIYEYQCAACGNKFEKLIRSQRDLPQDCPQCGKKKLKKLFSSFSAAVAGSFCKSADRCASGGGGGGHKHGPACGCGGGKCPL